MTKVLVHWPRADLPPDSVYWVGDDGTLRSYEAEETVSVLTGAEVVSQKVPHVPWLRYFQQLAERNPDIENWEVLTTDLAPRAFLERLRRGI